MRDYIKLLLIALILTFCSNVNAQLDEGILFKYENLEVVIFKHKKNVSLNYVGHKTEVLNLDYLAFLTILNDVNEKLPHDKGDVLQLYFFVNEKSEKQVFVNLLDRKLAKSLDYKKSIVNLCLGDCGKRNELQKIYVYTIENRDLKRYH